MLRSFSIARLPLALLPLFTGLAVSLLAPATAEGRLVRVAGSDLLPPALYESLENLADRRGDELQWSRPGSLPALRQLEAGEADLVLVALPERSPADFSYPVLPLAYGIGVLAVHRDNPLTSLTTPEIVALFTAAAGNFPTRWSGLGITEGPWAERSLTVVYADPPDRPVADLLRARFFPGQPIRSGITALPSSAATETFLQRDEGALGLLGRIPRSPALKAVALASLPSPPFDPSPANVNFGDYPLSLLYAVAVPRSQYRALAPYLARLFSAEAADLLEAGGFVPLLPALREEQVRSLP
jgi:hypothetical protein